MRISYYAMVLLSALVLAVQGCGPSSTEKGAPDKGQAKQSVFDLHAQLAQARDDVQREQERNVKLQAEAQTLNEKIGQMQAELNRARASERRVEPARPRQEAVGASDPGRIQLMGAKALAEYRAEQLSRRLDELSNNLDRKEAELDSIRQTAQVKEKEVAVLRQQIDKLQTAEQSRTTALTTRLDNISKELEERSAAAKKFKEELDDKTELLNALKTAIADANKLKSAADSESSRLQSELTEAKRQVESFHQQAVQWHQEAGQKAQEAAQKGQEAVQKAQEADQWRQEAERYRTTAEANAKELQELKAHAAELSGRLQAMEGEAEQQEEQDQSTIDRLLRGPKAQDSAESESNLY